jgi:hypothetical protein
LCVFMAIYTGPIHVNAGKVCFLQQLLQLDTAVVDIPDTQSLY